MSEISENINDVLSLQGLDLTKHVFDHNNLSNFLIECRDHIEKMENQNKLYFHAFNKAVVRIKELETSLRDVVVTLNSEEIPYMVRNKYACAVAEKVMEGKNDR